MPTIDISYNGNNKIPVNYGRFYSKENNCFILKFKNKSKKDPYDSYMAFDTEDELKQYIVNCADMTFMVPRFQELNNGMWLDKVYKDKVTVIDLLERIEQELIEQYEDEEIDWDNLSVIEE